MIRETTVRGRRLQYADTGAGQPLVLLHAFPLTHALWRHQLQAPPPGWRLVAPDLRGFGGSDRVAADAPARSPGARSMADYADDVAALLEELEIERPVVAGVSMGGYVAFALYRRLGGRISGLILADTRADADTEDARANRRRMQQLVIDRGVAAIADEMVPRLLGETTRREQPDIAEEVRGLIESNGAWAIHDALECLASRPDSTPALADIRCPALVVVGREDVLTPVPLAQSLHAGLANSQLEIVDGAGHLANLERPGEFGTILSEFLETFS
jgi:pimeloyl-ACP methyl ester carboxylesterase